MDESKIILETELVSDPDSKNEFGFYGMTGIVKHGKIVWQNPRLETDMQFERKEDNHIIFKLNHELESHKDYKGCSGAPILDNEGNLVSILIGGCKKRNEIIGLNLRRYKTALDIES